MKPINIFLCIIAFTAMMIIIVTSVVEKQIAIEAPKENILNRSEFTGSGVFGDKVKFHKNSDLIKTIDLKEKTITRLVPDAVLEAGKETDLLLQNIFLQGATILHFFHPETEFGLPDYTVCQNDSGNKVKNNYKYNDKGLLTKATHSSIATKHLISTVWLEYDDAGEVSKLSSYIGDHRYEIESREVTFSKKNGVLTTAILNNNPMLILAGYTKSLLTYDPTIIKYETADNSHFFKGPTLEWEVGNNSINEFKDIIKEEELSKFSIRDLVKKLKLDVKIESPNDPIEISSLSIIQTTLDAFVKSPNLMSTNFNLLLKTWNIRTQANNRRELIYDEKGRVVEIYYPTNSNMRCTVHYSTNEQTLSSATTTANK